MKSQCAFLRRRYYIELIGRRRVQVVGTPQDLDGYRVARVRPLVDDVLAAGSSQVGGIVEIWACVR